MTYESSQPVREWVAVIVVVATLAGFGVWKAWAMIAGFVADLKKAIDSVWRERR